MIETQRLILRQWKDSGLEPFARLNADPQVVEFLRKPLYGEFDHPIVPGFAHRPEHAGALDSLLHG